MSVTTFAIALIAATPLPAAPAAQTAMLDDGSQLAARPLSAGRAEQAQAALEMASAANPDDAALLINLGIAYAQQGEDAKARDAFERAVANDTVIELETADGTSTDSRRLARKAIRMLERGDFRPDAAARGEQVTLRD